MLRLSNYCQIPLLTKNREKKMRGQGKNLPVLHLSNQLQKPRKVAPNDHPPPWRLEAGAGLSYVSRTSGIFKTRGPEYKTKDYR